MSVTELTWDEAYLAESFYQRGSKREPDPILRKEGKGSYKKGYELRFVVCSEEELAELRQCLQNAGFKPSAPFRKSTRILQPVYGKENMERFMAIYAAYLKHPEDGTDIYAIRPE